MSIPAVCTCIRADSNHTIQRVLTTIKGGWESGTYTSSPEPETVGDHLRKKRLDLGLLQRDVAKELGVDPASVYNWENNRTEPHIKLMPAIIAFLGYLPYGDMSTMTTGEKIVTYRQALGLNQEELAHKLGVDPGTLARWEKGKGKPVSQLVGAVDQYLGTRSETQREA